MLTPILKFISEKDDDAKNKIVLAAAQKSEGKDHVRFRAMPDKTSITYRLELEPGVVQVIGKSINPVDDEAFAEEK